MKQIPLTQGKTALVSDRDFKKLSQVKWRAHRDNRSNKYYAARTCRRPDGTRYVLLMHRAITRARRGVEVDHRDGNGLNNCRRNLRLCTHQQNMYGQRFDKSGKSSKYKGVNFLKNRKKCWQARCCSKSLGLFYKEIDAARAYDRAAKKLFGRFAVLNFS